MVKKIIIVSGVDFATKIFEDFLNSSKNITLQAIADNPTLYEKLLCVKIEVLTFNGQSSVPFWFISWIKHEFIGVDNLKHKCFYIVQ